MLVGLDIATGHYGCRRHRLVRPGDGRENAGRGEEAAANTVPWSEVGPGWVLTTWSPVPAQDGFDKLGSATTTLTW